MKLRWKYRKLKWQLSVGPHWWIKPVWDMRGSHPRIQGITFKGVIEIPKGAHVSHCAFQPKGETV